MIIITCSIRQHVRNGNMFECDSAALTAALRAAAYVDWKLFRAARSLPWSLLVGCIATNLRLFAATTTPPVHPVALKVWKFARRNWDPGKLLAAVTPLGGIPGHRHHEQGLVVAVI